MVFIKCNQNHKEAMAVVESTPRNKVNMRNFFSEGCLDCLLSHFEHELYLI